MDEPAPAPTPTPPHGPDEVRAALIGAAARLFAERGPAAVSVRQIATAAGVNHGLVHHYFGSKERLLHEVVRERARRVVAEMGTAFAAGATADQDGMWAGHLWAALTADEDWKIVVRALLDGYGEDLLEPGAPRLQKAVERVRTGQQLGLLADDVDPSVVVAFGTALVWGSLVMRPLVQMTAAEGLEPDELVRQFGRMWRRAIGLPLAGEAGGLD